MHESQMRRPSYQAHPPVLQADASLLPSKQAAPRRKGLSLKAQFCIFNIDKAGKQCSRAAIASDSNTQDLQQQLE
jgi:hypothetical protein